MSGNALLQTAIPPTEPPKPIESGPIYIGNSNTRGVVMQIHLQRFQQALMANHAGLAAVAAWLSLGGHHWAALLGCGMGCLYSMFLNRLWIDLIQDTTTNLLFWNTQIAQLVHVLGIKDYLPPGTEIERPMPKVQSHQLYRPLKQCTVAWLALFVITGYQLSWQKEEIGQWMLPFWEVLRSGLLVLC